MASPGLKVQFLWLLGKLLGPEMSLQQITEVEVLFILPKQVVHHTVSVVFNQAGFWKELKQNII